jgi:predicted transcriptional regulator
MADNKKAGRKGKYETHVLPFFDRIDRMLNEGASERQVAEALGVSYPAWNRYKVQYPALGELCSKPRTKLIEDLRSALVKRALGFTYEEKKQYITEDENGSKKKHTEITTKYAVPDTTAIIGSLNIYDPEYVKDKKAHELKEQELELRRMQAEFKNW